MIRRKLRVSIPIFYLSMTFFVLYRAQNNLLEDEIRLAMFHPALCSSFLCSMADFDAVRVA